jgi:hypothetical protein
MSGAVRIWWRDDDAGRDSEKLTCLLDLATRARRPLGLAVVPAWLEPEVTSKVLAADGVDVLQHGWNHADHASAGSKKIELGGGLRADGCSLRLRDGKAVLARAFGDRFLSVLVPPWNRIDGHCLATLQGIGFAGLSTFADDARGAAHGLRQVNTHVDVIDWHGSRRMKPLAELRDELVRQLAKPALGTIGLLSHHLDMTLEEMAALEQFFRYVDSIDRCRWASPRRLFAPS